MLTYLRVRNLAIVEELAIEPGSGLNVLTGETGAGKSLLIDSLQFLSGARGSTELIRGGSERMNAEAIFRLPADTAGRFVNEGISIEISNGAYELIIIRELQTGGRGRALVNGTPLTIRQLAGWAESLLEIHGQGDSERIAGQTLRELLDEYAGAGELAGTTREHYAEWQRAASALAELRAAEHDRALRVDLLKYQIDELEGARLEPGEEESLRTERAILANAHELVSAAGLAWQLIDEDDSSAVTQLGRSLQALLPLSRSIEEVRSIHTELDELRARLNDVSRSLASIASSVRHDPERLDAIEQRLDTIERLKKKYGATIEQVLGHLARSREEYDRLIEYELRLEEAQTEEEARFASFVSLADALSEQRKSAAVRFETEVETELRDLAMERTGVRIVVATKPDESSRLQYDGRGTAFGPEGYDRVEALIAANRGEELRPIQRVASGGELSRIQLAMAAALFRNAGAGSAATLVFDEIDSGVGGRVAEAVGRKLRELSENNQVICVTHLPQIAALGSTHFRVWKEDHAGRTHARIEPLETLEQRVEEIARMLGGATVTDSARQHARELLDLGAERGSRKGRTAGAVPAS